MKTYQYKGKERSAAGSIRLNPEQTVELNDKDAHVQSLIAKKLLIEDKKQPEIKSIEKKYKK